MMEIILFAAFALIIFPFLVHLGVSIPSKSRENLQNTSCSSNNQNHSATVSNSRLLHNPSGPATHQNNEHPDPPFSHVIDLTCTETSDVSAAIVNPKTCSQSNTASRFFRTHSFPSTAAGTGTTQQSLPDHSSSVYRKMDSSSFSGDARLYMNYTTRLGFQCHVIDVRMLQRDQLIRIMEDRDVVAAAAGESLLVKTTFGVTFQAATGLMIFYYQSLPPSSSSAPGHNGGNRSTVHYVPLPLPIRIISIVMVIGFSASLVGILLRKQHPVLAAISVKLGSASTVLGFFITMSVLLPGISQLIGWFAASISFIAFAYTVIKMK